jgi:hypothetical protein
MSHPKHHNWLFSIDAVECVEIMKRLRAKSVPALSEWIPNEWLDAAIEIGACSEDNEGWFRSSPEEIAFEVWQRLKPDDTYLLTDEKGY